MALFSAHMTVERWRQAWALRVPKEYILCLFEGTLRTQMYPVVPQNLGLPLGAPGTPSSMCGRPVRSPHHTAAEYGAIRSVFGAVESWSLVMQARALLFVCACLRSQGQTPTHQGKQPIVTLEVVRGQANLYAAGGWGRGQGGRGVLYDEQSE